VTAVDQPTEVDRKTDFGDTTTALRPIVQRPPRNESCRQ
jgi:hypothetical protein